MSEHEIYIGDKIERAIEIIGEESDEVNSWQLLDQYIDGNIQPRVELRENYLYVEVPE